MRTVVASLRATFRATAITSRIPRLVPTIRSKWNG